MFTNLYNEFARKFTKSVAYTSNEKAAFHTHGMRLLKTLGAELGISADYRSNKGGIAVSGEITLHADNIYIQLYQPAFSALPFQFLVRECKGRKDYCGGTNHFHDKGSPEALKALARRILGE